MTNPTLIRQWLGILHGDCAGHVQICHTGSWAGRCYPTTDLDGAAAYAAMLDERPAPPAGIYARVTTLQQPPAPGQRGGAAGTLHLPALWADLDIAGPGHQHDPDRHGGRPLPPDTEAARKVIHTSGLPTPTLWVHSGGGLYPIWLLDRPHQVDGAEQLAGAQALGSTWQRIIEHAAASLGWHYGRGTGDLARVLRVPGTTNRKVPGDERPCLVVEATGTRHPYDELQAAAADALAHLAPPPASPATSAAARPAGSELSPGDDYNTRGDWGELLGRHGWREHYRRDEVTYWTRPGKTSGISASTNALGTNRLHVFTTAAELAADESYSLFGAYAALDHGGDFKAAATVLRRLGYGTSPTDPATGQRAMLADLLPGQPPPSAPAKKPKPIPTGGMRYFSIESGRRELMAATLACDVMATGPLAVGIDDIMWSYAGGVWSPDRLVVRNRVTGLLGELYRQAHASNAEHVVRAQVPTITCDPVSDVINFRNGLLDWRTGQLRPHTPDVPTTVQLAVPWQPGATCPRFEAFLHQVVPIDMVDVVWELVGYLMYSGNPLHKAIMLVGGGRNGKGTLLRAIVAVLGKRNVTAASLHDLVGTRFTTASLFGKLANIAGDIDATYLESTATFKAITGQDQISAEHKGRDRFDFTPWAVPVFSANEVPPSSDTTTGYLSRWLVIPFPNSFTGREDRTLDSQLQAELPGIAFRAVFALRRLIDRGDFAKTASGQSAYDEFARRVDQVRAWLGECCEVASGPHEASSHPHVNRCDLYSAYTSWCRRDGGKPVKATTFYDRLTAIGCSPLKLRGVNGFRGVTIIDDGTRRGGRDGDLGGLLDPHPEQERYR